MTSHYFHFTKGSVQPGLSCQERFQKLTLLKYKTENAKFDVRKDIACECKKIFPKIWRHAEMRLKISWDLASSFSFLFLFEFLQLSSLHRKVLQMHVVKSWWYKSSSAASLRFQKLLTDMFWKDLSKASISSTSSQLSKWTGSYLLLHFRHESMNPTKLCSAFSA